MSIAFPVVPLQRRRALPAIFWGGVIAGAVDITYAIVFWWIVREVKPIRVLQSVASGLLGMNSFQMGAQSAALGLLCHFAIAFGAAATYYIASSSLRSLREKPFLWGPIYGIAVYLFMNYVVLPLSAAPKFKYTALSVSTGILVHMFGIGLPIAIAARRYGR